MIKHDSRSISTLIGAPKNTSASMKKYKYTKTPFSVALTRGDTTPPTSLRLPRLCQPLVVAKVNVTGPWDRLQARRDARLWWGAWHDTQQSDAMTTWQQCCWFSNPNCMESWREGTMNMLQSGCDGTGRGCVFNTWSLFFWFSLRPSLLSTLLYLESKRHLFRPLKCLANLYWRTQE